MKRIISLLLVLVLAFSALFLVACDKTDKKDEGKETKAKVTNKVDDSDDDDDDDDGPKSTEEPKEPVAVSTLNGKTAKQLLEDFVEDYTNARSFDMTLNAVESYEGEAEYEMNVSLKLTETEAYVDMEMDGEKITVWYVDGVAYVETSEGKFKSDEVAPEEILGEDFFEEMMSSMPTEIDDAIAQKYEEAQLYYFKNAYYVTIIFTDEEAEEMGYGEGYTETLYFDKTGKLRKIEVVSSENTMTVLLNSYGETVKIDPPKNASEFVDADDSEDTPEV